MWTFTFLLAISFYLFIFADKSVTFSYEDLLIFITGADKIPPTGFPSAIHIEFYSYDGAKRLPFTSTCALTLSLPRGINNPDEFSDIMKTCLTESSGFGKM